MIIYLYKGENHKGKDGEVLIKKALQDYSNDKYEAPVIGKGRNGKPYFENIPVYFSISHSGEIWTCLMADFNVGLDIQVLKSLKYEKVSERFFTEDETDYIKKKGADGFFEVWTRKEAYVKYTGKGFANQGFTTFSTVNQEEIVEELEADGENVYFMEINLPMEDTNMQEKIFGAACVHTKEDIAVKEL